MRTIVDTRIKKGLNADYIERDNETLEKARAQLDEYLSGERKTFDIELALISKKVFGMRC